MKIVIDIDDAEYEIIKAYTAPMTWAEHLIAKGTPLPKGHGRLIDADELYGDFIDGTEGYDCQTWNRIEIGDIIEYAPTIIEADKAESEDKDDERMTDRETDELLKKAVAALEERANAQPCDDAISRVDALNAVTMAAVRSVAIENIKLIPNTYQRPTGRWIEKEDYNLDTYYECSECGADYCIEGDILIHKYCPNCGARMAEVEPQAESEK